MKTFHYRKPGAEWKASKRPAYAWASPSDDSREPYRKAGRPKGASGKYTDAAGKPIGVYQWRKLNSSANLARQQRSLKYPETAEVEKLLSLLIESSGKSKNDILLDSLKCYLKQHLGGGGE